MLERRKRRSPSRGVALDYQLEAVRSKFDLPALVLADDQGLVVAAAGESVESTAYETIATRSVTNGSARAELTVLHFSTRGDVFTLASTGDASAEALNECRRGVERILSA